MKEKTINDLQRRTVKRYLHLEGLIKEFKAGRDRLIVFGGAGERWDHIVGHKLATLRPSIFVGKRGDRPN